MYFKKPQWNLYKVDTIGARQVSALLRCRKRSHAIHWEDWILSFMIICLIFHTAIIINRKNWRITVKLHFENTNIKKKRSYTHARTPLPMFVFVYFSMIPPLPSSTNKLFEWPLSLKLTYRILVEKQT